MARKSPEIKSLHNGRINIIRKVRVLEKSEDSKKKYTALIKLCKEFASLTKQLQDFGEQVTIGPQKFHVTYWEDKYRVFNNKTNPKTEKEPSVPVIKKKPVQTNTSNDANIYFIMLCWTVKQEFCVCESIIEKIRGYMKYMNIKSADLSKSEFPDRVEFCEMFKIKCTQETYETTIKSVQYLLEISTDSIYDKCNIGVFGKKAE